MTLHQEGPSSGFIPAPDPSTSVHPQPSYCQKKRAFRVQNGVSLQPRAQPTTCCSPDSEQLPERPW